jgi:hypothetical protein
VADHVAERRANPAASRDEASEAFINGPYLRGLAARGRAGWMDFTASLAASRNSLATGFKPE